jgi:hypothetical protein
MLSINVIDQGIDCTAQRKKRMTSHANFVEVLRI